MQQKRLLAGSKSNKNNPSVPIANDFDEFKSKPSTFDEICILSNRDKYLEHYKYVIDDCPYYMIRIILKLYGFYPCGGKLIHRLIVAICLTLGMYTLIQIESNTQYKTNYYGATISMIYPILYVCLLYYFTQTTHFWNLCKVHEKTSDNKKIFNILVIIGLIISFLFASLQKIIWAIQQDRVRYDQDIKDLVMLIIFAVTFILRLNELCIICVIFWIISDFHHKQITIFKDKLSLFRTEGKKSINNDDENAIKLTEDEILEKTFDIHTAIYLDVSYTNSCIQSYLTPFLSMVAISLIIIVLGLLFEFVDIWQFLNNIWELVIMFIVSLIVLLKSAHITWKFKGVKKIFIALYNKRIILNYEKIMQFVDYFDTNKVGIKLSGLLLDYSIIVRYSIALISSALAIGIRALQYSKW